METGKEVNAGVGARVESIAVAGEPPALDVMILPAGVCRRIHVDAGKIGVGPFIQVLEQDSQGKWQGWKGELLSLEGLIHLKCDKAFDPFCGYSREQAWIETHAQIRLHGPVKLIFPDYPAI